MGDAKEGLVVSCADTIETYRTHVSILFKLQIKAEKILNGTLRSLIQGEALIKGEAGIFLQI